MAIFITGTDTNVGKTLIAAWLCLKSKANYWKPIQTGSVEGTDTNFIKSYGIKTYAETYVFKNPLSPHMAAFMENVTINPKSISLPSTKPLIVEGAGGVLVPLTKNYLMIDLIHSLKLPVIIVARSTLGTINHTCLTLEVLRRRKILVLGVIVNGPYNEKNMKAIEEFGNTTVLASFPSLENIHDSTIREIPLPPLLKNVLDQNL